ncbi:UPF0472 protein C16orf72 -like protein [Sarcoptes scabiei]|uniref:DUF4588 domain containing protein n=1 Tax=Sarcoptes scabiei TaxID=52283 RepID=A0A132AJA6_SARSC|nr:UPF0472 protein C16orf72 -like protein [Sarcoptes scabiei]KPM10665.1 DUF4588 domain containing protein [Sarcoptes scabiei]
MDPIDNNDLSSQRFSPFEQECIDYIEKLPNHETENENEKLSYERKQWNLFQNSATSIAQLYSRDNLPLDHVWNTFQQASINVTSLYKESVEYHKKNYDVFHHTGYHKRTKEVLNWIKKKKPLIRREELLAFLSGHTDSTYLHGLIHHPYHHNHHHHLHRFALTRSGRSTRNETDRYSIASNPNARSNTFLILNNDSSRNQESKADEILSANNNNENENNLETFKKAIVSSFKNPNVFLNNHSNNTNNIKNNINNNKLDSWNEDLNDFIDQQYHRYGETRKRTSSMDICMESPNSNKKTKFS